MTDRIPGKPGQYKATVTAAELEKLQSGQQFVITLVRDDQPTTAGTPYNKASVLPDTLAAVICPDVADPTPADALGNLLPLNGGKAMTGNLKMGGFQINNLADPAADTDAVHKRYVDRRGRFENYLDNSDFSNPVNQRGAEIYTASDEYSIDRWINDSGMIVQISDGCLELTNDGTYTKYLTQLVNRNLAGKNVWLAACLEDGTVYAIEGTVPAAEVTSNTAITSGVRGDGFVLSLQKTRKQQTNVQLGLQQGRSVRLKWAMLYEGDEIAMTDSIIGDVRSRVPNYIPKGYATELLECMRYYQIRSTNDVPPIDLRPLMVHDTPSISEVDGGYAYEANI